MTNTKNRIIVSSGTVYAIFPDPNYIKNNGCKAFQNVVSSALNVAKATKCTHLVVRFRQEMEKAASRILRTFGGKSVIMTAPPQAMRMGN